MRRRSIVLVVILVAFALISNQSVLAQVKEPAKTPAAMASPRKIRL